MAIIRKASGRKPGEVFQWPANSTPPGALDCPVAQTLVDIADFPKLFKAVGVTWGGDGVTKFGLPYCPNGYALVKGNAGTVTVGQVLAHTHTTYYSCGYDNDQVNVPTGGSFNRGNGRNIASASTGAGSNLAAGVGMKLCVQYA